MDTLTNFLSAVATGLLLFIAAHVEPAAGVWVAAVAGGALSATTGKDRGSLSVALSFILAVLVGVFSSQILAGLFHADNDKLRVAEAFFCALFAEKIVAGIGDGSLLKLLLSRKGLK